VTAHRDKNDSTKPQPTRRQMIGGLGALAATMAMPSLAQAQVGVMFNDPVGFFRAAFPNNPVRIDMPMPGDGWQWFERTDLFIANGTVITAQIARLHWTPRFRIAMQLQQAGPADTLLADDQALLRRVVSEQVPFEFLRASTFDGFETRGIQAYIRDLGENNPRPLRLSWIIPYAELVIAAHVKVADESQFQSAEALAFNQSFEVFPPSMRRREG